MTPMQWFAKHLNPKSLAAQAAEFVANCGPTDKEQEDPEQALFKSMCEQADKERARIAQVQRDNGVRYIARQILTAQAKDLNPRIERVSQRDATAAMEQAIRIYDLIENTSTEAKRED